MARYSAMSMFPSGIGLFSFLTKKTPLFFMGLGQSM